MLFGLNLRRFANNHIASLDALIDINVWA